MKFDAKVTEVLNNAETLAKAKGLKSYGMPHIMMALMDKDDFKSSYSGNYSRLENFVSSQMKLYSYPAVSGLKGYDASMLYNKCLPDSFNRFKKILDMKDISLAHVLVLMCKVRYFQFR